MLSKKSKRLLQWLSENDTWAYRPDVQAVCPVYDDRAFSALVSGGYVDSADWDTDRQPDQPRLLLYRISDKGRAYLELKTEERWKEFRAWITLGIAIGSLLLSLIALLR